MSVFWVCDSWWYMKPILWMLTGDDLFAPRVAQDWQEADVLPLSAPAQNARPARKARWDCGHVSC